MKQIDEWYKKLKRRKQSLSDTLTSYVRDSLKAAGFSGICVSDLWFDYDWKPKIMLHHYGFPYSGRYIGGRRFVVTAETSIDKIYSNEIVNMELPFDGDKVLKLCEKLTEQLGVYVGFFETKLV